MSDFMKALEKTDPEMFASAKKTETEAEKVTSMSFQDMKDYFDAMQEKLRNDMKKDMDDYIKAIQTKVEKEEGGQNNASSSDLLDSKQNSEEH